MSMKSGTGSDTGFDSLSYSICSSVPETLRGACGDEASGLACF